MLIYTPWVCEFDGNLTNTRYMHEVTQNRPLRRHVESFCAIQLDLLQTKGLLQSGSIPVRALRPQL